ncbi:hypothetical protein ADL35_27595, partial [Streptomyces sp. NRRL WC-3753]
HHRHDRHPGRAEPAQVEPAVRVLDGEADGLPLGQEVGQLLLHHAGFGVGAGDDHALGVVRGAGAAGRRPARAGDGPPVVRAGLGEPEGGGVVIGLFEPA